MYMSGSNVSALVNCLILSCCIYNLNSTLNINTYFPKVLHSYIEAFKVYHFEEEGEVHLYPKGVFEIVFQSQHSFQHNTDYSSGWELRPRNFIGGLHNKSYYVNPGRSQNYCIVVEFKPNTAKYFIPEKLHVFQNAVIDIFDIWGKSARKLAQKIDAEKFDNHKIEHIEDFLIHKLSRTNESIIDLAIGSLINYKGFIEVTAMAHHAGLSSSQFRKRFKEEVGISPSQYCKIVRVNSSLSIMQKNNHRSLTQITYELGYFDQSHFIKDFKSIMGRSPTAFLQESVF